MKSAIVACLVCVTALLGGCSSYTHGGYGPSAPEVSPVAAANSIGVTSRSVAGAYVVEVAKYGPADKAGVHVGDLILELDGKPVHGTPELEHRLLRIRPGRNVGITLLRRNRERWKTVLVRGLYRGGRDEAELIEPDLGVDTVTAHGSYVVDTWDDGPARELGLRSGDVILELGGRATGRPGDMAGALTHLHPGLPASILYLSHGTLLLEEVTPGTVLLDENGRRYPEASVYKFKIPILFGYRKKTTNGQTYSTVEIGNLWFLHLFRYRGGPEKTGIEILSIPFDWLL